MTNVVLALTPSSQRCYVQNAAVGSRGKCLGEGFEGVCIRQIGSLKGARMEGAP